MANHQMETPALTPASSIRSSAKDKERRAKGYKRIKFKTWQPDGLPGAGDQLRSGTHRWRVNGTANKRTTEQVPGEEQQGLLKTKYSYRCPSPIQQLPVNGHRQDPFVTLPIEATECVTAALDFFLATCVPENRNSEWLVGRPNPHMSMLFPFMLKEAMLFETIIALCRASILLAQGKKAEEDRWFVHHRMRAIKAVTANLTTVDGISDASILSMTMILTLEYLIGNVAAVATHLGGIQRMMALRPDLDGSTHWKRFVKAGVLAYQSLGSFVTGEPVQIPGTSSGFIKEAFSELELDRALTYPTVPFSPDLCTILARLPTGFAELCLSGAISQQTMKLLAFAQATTSSHSTTAEFDERLDHEVQIMLSALQRLTLMRPSSVERRLFCGLLAFAFQLRQLRPLNLFHDPALRGFVTFLGQHERPDSQRVRDSMIWVCVAAAGALALRTITMPGSEKPLERIFELYPAAADWNVVEKILKAHFWTEKIGTHWRTCWEVGLARWRVVERTRKVQGDVVRLSFPGSEASVVGPDLAVDKRDGGGARKGLGEVSLESITAHSRGAAHSIAQMMEASIRCPFQSRVGPSIEGAEMMMAAPAFSAADLVRQDT